MTHQCRPPHISVVSSMFLYSVAYWSATYVLLVLQLEGDITYNGHELNEFVVQRTAAYIEQSDLHEPQVRVAVCILGRFPQTSACTWLAHVHVPRS